MPPSPDPSGTARVAPAPWQPVLGWLGLSLIWAVTIAVTNAGSLYTALGTLALVVVAVVTQRCRKRIRKWLEPSLRQATLGAVAGAAMVGLTYPAFGAATAIWPGLRVEVANLYELTRPASTLSAGLWLCAIVPAEELLWRGALLDALRARMPAAQACGLSLLTYAACQAGEGSWLVPALALVCGALWLGLRFASGSLIAPLVAHLIWTPTVLLLWPLA